MPAFVSSHIGLPILLNTMPYMATLVGGHLIVATNDPLHLYQPAAKTQVTLYSNVLPV